MLESQLRTRVSRVPGLRRAFRTTKALPNVVLRRDYPTRLTVSQPNMKVVDFVREHGCQRIAEIGCYHGHTTLELARLLDGEGEIHVFDFTENVDRVVGNLRSAGYQNVVGFPNTHHTYDSYNWSLMRLLQEHDEPIYDFVLLDGAHTWAHDALAFLLVERLIVPGGYIHFDDYEWSLAKSNYLNPDVFPATRKHWTKEQISEQHVKMIVETLVRPDPRWREVAERDTFQKI